MSEEPVDPGTFEEAEEPEEEAIEIDADFVVFRVFAINRTYQDRPTDNSWMWTGQRGPPTTDTTTVTVGDLTAEFTAAVRALRAWQPFVLNLLFDDTYKDKSSDELEAIVEDLLPDDGTAVAPYIEPGRTYITVTLRRQVRVLASPSRIHRWLTDFGPLENAGKFVEEAGEYLDVTGVRLMEPLGQKLAPNMVVYRSNRAFLFASGKTPILTDFQPRVGTAPGSGFGDGWNSIDWQPVTELLNEPHAPNDARLIKSASRWLWAAMAETNDTLRRFLFAFFGLEILANKCGKHYEGHLVERLSGALNDAPLKELFWPTPRDADSPWRNLVFRFAVMAVYLNPVGAADDVTLFKRLASARNELAHGTAGDDAIHDLPATEAIVLLSDYLQRTAAADDA